MKFVVSRDLRDNPSAFREAVEEEDVVLTVGGRPFAVVVGVEEKEHEETLGLIRGVRALRALARIRRSAEEQGIGGMSTEEIDEEVGKSRRSRRRFA